MTIVFTFPEQHDLARTLCRKGKLRLGKWEWRHYPENESYVRLLSRVKSSRVIILCSLDDADKKFLPLVFLSQALRKSGAKEIILIAPYLGYMRHDKEFKKGEVITSSVFAGLLSEHIDSLLTIDPHLHRHKHLEEIYTCKCTKLTAAPLLAEWIKKNVRAPVLIGPDSESEQWVKAVSLQINAPYIISRKTRLGDRKVKISLPDLTRYKNNTPVLIDDIISTGTTLGQITKLLYKHGYKKIICLATHGIFVDDAYNKLLKIPAIIKIVTTNTIGHNSSKIDVAELIITALSGKL